MHGNPADEPAEEDVAAVADAVDVEVIDGPLVLAGSGSRQIVVRGLPAGVALAQTAAVAATGFVAGVATAAVLGRRRQRRLQGSANAGLPDRASGPAGAYRALSHRTYLVDVHLLERR
jgi:hypothetical protein